MVSALPMLTEFFTLTATTLAARDPAHANTWRIDAVPWTENRVDVGCDAGLALQWDNPG